MSTRRRNKKGNYTTWCKRRSSRCITMYSWCLVTEKERNVRVAEEDIEQRETSLLVSRSTAQAFTHHPSCLLSSCCCFSPLVAGRQASEHYNHRFEMLPLKEREESENTRRKGRRRSSWVWCSRSWSLHSLPANALQSFSPLHFCGLLYEELLQTMHWWVHRVKEG